MIDLVWCRRSLLGIVLLQPIWFVLIAPPERIPVAIALAVTLLPLLAVLPGSWRLNARSLVIAGCLLMLYFCLAVMEVWVNPAARWPGLIQVVLITIFFIALPAVRKQPRRSDSGA